MSNTSYTQFTMTHKGEDYLVEADLTYTPQECSNKNFSASDWDLEAELSFENVYIVDKNNKDVTECLDITDSELKSKLFREMELMKAENEEEMGIHSYGLDEEDFGKSGFMRTIHLSSLVDSNKNGDYY